MKRIQQPKIEIVNGRVHMDCPHCQIHKVVDEQKNAQFAYLEINKFRKDHEHILSEK